MHVTVSVPASLILAGEEGVFFGKPAFATAIDYRIRLRLESAVKEISSSSSLINRVRQEVIDYLKVKKIKHKVSPVAIFVDSSIPQGEFWGEKAALVVAATAFFYHLFTDQTISRESLVTLAYQNYKKVYPQSLGLRISTSTYGGTVFYRREFPFLQTVSSLQLKFPSSFIERCLLFNVSVPDGDDKDIRQLVSQKYQKNPKLVSQILVELEKMTKRLVVAISAENLALFQQTLVDSQILLEKLGLVDKQVFKLLNKLAPWGAGKIVGWDRKNSRNYLVLFFTPKAKLIEDYLKKQKIRLIRFKPTVAGIDFSPKLNNFRLPSPYHG